MVECVGNPNPDINVNLAPGPGSVAALNGSDTRSVPEGMDDDESNAESMVGWTLPLTGGLLIANQGVDQPMELMFGNGEPDHVMSGLDTEPRPETPSIPLTTKKSRVNPALLTKVSKSYTKVPKVPAKGSVFIDLVHILLPANIHTRQRVFFHRKPEETGETVFTSHHQDR